MKKPQNVPLNTYVPARQAKLDLDFCHAEDKLPDARLYPFPSVDCAQPMFPHRLNELLERVRDGATLYLSLGNALFRRLPELTGLTFATRSQRTGADAMIYGNESIPMTNRFCCRIESIADGYEMLAAVQQGTPVYVRNAYGRGQIYFPAVPLEQMISETPNVFKDDGPDQAALYRAFAVAADQDRIVSCGEKQVLVSEHPLDDHRHVIVAVDLQESSDDCPLTCAKGWQATRCRRGILKEGRLQVLGCDAAVWQVERKTR